MSLSCFSRRAFINLFDNNRKFFLRATVYPALSQNSILHQKKVESVSFDSRITIAPFSTSKSVLAAAGHDHSRLWTVERFVAAALIPLVPAAFIAPSPPLDIAITMLTVMHVHWGVEAIVIDYVRPSIFGTVIPKIGVGLVYLFSISVLAGLTNIIFNDVGVIETVKLLWKL